MQTLSDMLQQLMDANSYTTYQLANLSGVNRTTIQRTLTSGRCPKKNAFEKLAASLNLTDEERRLFYDAYERMAEGDFYYFRRNHVKYFLENTEFPFPLMDRTITLQQSISLHEPLFSKTLVQGFLNISRLLKILLDEEIHKNTMLEIRLALPSGNKLIEQFFQELNNYTAPRLTINHLIFLVKNPVMLKDHKSYNLNLLASFFPYVLSQNHNYEVHYTYSNYSIENIDYGGFPYYILFSDCVLLFSSDLNTVRIENERDIFDYMSERFSSLFENTSRLLSTISADWPLNSTDKFYKNPKFLYSISFQPCFSLLFDKNFCEQIQVMDSDFFNTEQELEILLENNKMIYELDEFINIFHEKSLEAFIHDGIIMALFPNIIRALQPYERLQLLNLLYRACSQGIHVFRIINPVNFMPPWHLALNISEKNCFELAFYDKQEQKLYVNHIFENTLSDTFCDFLSYLPRSSMVYDQETTLNIIDKYRKQMEQMIID